MKKMTFDRWIAVLGAALSIIYMLSAWRLPRFTLAVNVDAHVFPMLVGVVLLLLSIWLFVSAKGDGSPEKSPWVGLEIHKGLSMMILAIIYIICLQPVGFIISTMVFLILAPFALGWRRWIISIPLAVVFSVSMYLIFDALMVTLPRGIFSL